MKVEKIALRGVLFTFDELLEKYGCRTSVYVIVCPDYYYFCDSYLGESYVEKIKQYREAEYGAKQHVLFNSHYHWDHITSQHFNLRLEECSEAFKNQFADLCNVWRAEGRDRIPGTMIPVECSRFEEMLRLGRLRHRFTNVTIHFNRFLLHNEE